jgi:hypothetical protein
MDFFQVVFMAEMLTESEIRREKQLMRSSALLAWLMGYGPKKTYCDFTESLGLSDDRIVDVNDRKRAIEKSRSVIEKLNNLRGIHPNG